MKKRETLFDCMEAFLFSAALSAGNLFCLITAFKIPVDAGALAWSCIFAAAICAFVFAKDKIRITKIAVFLILTAVLMLYNRQTIRDGFWIAARRVGDVYSEGYQWHIDFGAAASSGFGNATGFMAAVGVLICAVSAWSVCGKHQLWVLCAVSAALLVPCLLVMDYPPAVWAVVLLTVTYAMLLLTQSRRKAGAGGRHGLAAGLLIPVLAAALVAVAVLNPAEYVRSKRMEDFSERFRQEIQKYFVIRQNQSTGMFDFVSPLTASTLGTYAWNSDTGEVDLSGLGPQMKDGRHVMDVSFPRSGPLYLRGNALGKYSDNGWHAFDENDYGGITVPDKVWETVLQTESEVKVLTGRRSEVMYLPYVPTSLPEGAVPYFDAYVKNTGGTLDYTVPVSVTAQYMDIWSNTEAYDSFVREYCTQVPDETRNALADIVSELTDICAETGRPETEVVREYVMNSARYSLNTSRMPEGEEFVSWFLNESDTGYCVHFATSAAVLLRCMGVPARYVNGYMVNSDAGKWTEVTQDNAHAWVEYYSAGYGWHMLEVTPSSGDGETGDPEYEPELPEQEPRPENEVNADTENREEEDKREDTQKEPEEEKKENSILLRIIIPILIAAAVFVLWNVGARKVRRRILNRGTTNDRAIAHYRHSVFMSKLRRESVPEEIEEIALKARFSQHVTDGEELGRITAYTKELTDALLSDGNVLRRLVYRFIFAL